MAESTAAVDADLVFTVCNLQSGSQGLCALKATSGTLMWSFTPPGGATTYPETAPVVANATIYFGACTNECEVYAVSESSGTMVWATNEKQQCASTTSTR